jgi:hypothetical protein
VAEALSGAVRCPDRKPDKVCDQHRHRLPADSLYQHERGIHALRFGTDCAGVTEARFRVHATASAMD